MENPTAAQQPTLAGKFLTYKLGSEGYGLQILKVQEIIKMLDVTPVPRTPKFIRGVVNLRGKIVPVVDLKYKFGMGENKSTEKTCIIIVQVKRAENTIIMGVIVDEVSEVLDIASGQIEPPPAFGSSVDTQFILGMAKTKGGVIILLDIDNVLSAAEMDVVAVQAA